MNTRVNNSRRFYHRAMAVVALITILTAASTQLKADTGTCGGQMIALPFTDVPSSNVFFCSIAEAYFSGLSNGTTATTYGTGLNVPREQMSAFVTRTLDQSLRRGSHRAAMDQFWTNQGGNSLGLTTLAASSSPQGIRSDGADLWVASPGTATVSRVRASDGKLLDPPWTGANGAFGVLIAMGKVFVTGTGSPGKLYSLDPTLAPGIVTTVTNVGNALGIAFDGQRIWTANQGAGSVSIVTVSPLSVSTATAGFTNLAGIVFDGTNMWVTDKAGAVDKLHKLNSSGAILQSVDVGNDPQFPAFDGTNIWVPNQTSNSVTVVRATGSLAGTVLATLTGNGLNGPWTAAFDGERILIANTTGSSVSLWKAADLTPIGTFSTGTSTNPQGACSDGLNFWLSLTGANKVARF
jgi:hypothetical protein